MKHLAKVMFVVGLCLAVWSSGCGGAEQKREDLGGPTGDAGDIADQQGGELPDAAPGDEKDVELADEKATDAIPEELVDQVQVEADKVGPDEKRQDGEVWPSECTHPCNDNSDCEDMEGQTICWKAYCLPNEECAALGEEFAKQCVLKKTLGCCEGPDADKQCQDDDPCTINEKCVNNKCQAENDFSNPDCQVDVELFGDNFEQYVVGNKVGEGTLAGFLASSNDSTGKVFWSIQESPCGKGLAAYLGNPDCLTYYNGQLVNGCELVEEIPCEVATEEEDCPPPATKCDPDKKKCVSDPLPKRIVGELGVEGIVVPKQAFTSVTFRLWMEAEEPYLEIKGDYLTLVAKEATPEGPVEHVLFDSHTDLTPKGNNTNGQCVFVAAELTEFAGKALDLVWRFDTESGTDNNYKGVFLDDIRVATYKGKSTCNESSDCDDGKNCTDDQCVKFANKEGGLCVNDLKFEHCVDCTSVSDCEGLGPHPEDPVCFPPACQKEAGAETGFCTWLPNPACCGKEDMGNFYSEGFEGGTLPAGFAVDTVPKGSSVAWQVVEGKGAADEGPGKDTFALYFGDPTKWNYDCGQDLCAGSVTTSKIDLSSVSSKAFVKLSFLLLMTTEWDENDKWFKGIDYLTVEARPEGGEWSEVWISDFIKGTTLGEYVEVWADLTPFRGEVIQLRFTFTTGDATPPKNEFFGVLIDEISIDAVCDAVCSVDAQCKTSGPCQEAKCVGGKCTVASIPECCVKPDDPACDDGDECTVDKCDVSSLTCVHEFDKSKPDCCSPKENLFFEDFEDLAKFDPLQDSPDPLTVWSIPKPDIMKCGDGWPDEVAEDCHVCPADWDQCPVAWNVVEKDPFDGKRTMYFGNPTTWNYKTPPGEKESWGEIFSPVFTIPEYGIPVLDFMLKLDTEYCGPTYDLFVEPPPVAFDLFSILAQCSADGKEWTAPEKIWDSMAWDMKGCTWDSVQQGVVWKKVSVGMKKFIAANCDGKQQLRFVLAFHSGDPSNNEGQGVFVDNLSVKTVCEPYECSSAFECPEVSPENPHCTIEVCDKGKCTSKDNANKEGCVKYEVLAFYTFDEPCGMSGWTTDTPAAKVKWQADGFQKHSGQCALYFGNSQTHTYDDPGKTVKGCVKSPTIDVTGYNKIIFSFWKWWDILDADPSWDKLEIKIHQAINASGELLQGKSTLIWSKPCPVSKCQGGYCDSWGCEDLVSKSWQVYDVPIDIGSLGWVNLSQKWAVFEICFDSGDNSKNNGTGVYLDDVVVKVKK